MKSTRITQKLRKSKCTRNVFLVLQGNDQLLVNFEWFSTILIRFLLEINHPFVFDEFRRKINGEDDENEYEEPDRRKQHAHDKKRHEGGGHNARENKPR
jgi:hypothetical protein